jgi:teichoic acid transport system permease protein
LLTTLRTIITDNWEHRRQIGFLAVMELRKAVHGTWLGWLWLVLKPIVYVAAFWFALEIGLRADRQTASSVPYIIWLGTGIFVWQYMSSMITSGSNVYKNYSYLVTKLRFPIAVIPSFHSLGKLLVFGLTQIILVIAMLVWNTGFTIYLLQWPLLVILLYFTFTVFSLMTAPLSALSRDFHNALTVLNTPIFWLSGIIFDVSRINIAWIKWVLRFNPVTFFAKAFRGCLGEGYWFWSDPLFFFPFLCTLLVMIILALWVQTRLKKEIPDVI